jgi:hypothetical protein
VGGEAGGQVPEPVAERLRLGVAEALLVVQADEPRPGGQVGGDGRGEDPAAVDLLCLGWQVAQAHGLAVADAVFHDGVLAVQHVDELGVVAARDAGDPAIGMFVQVTE